MQLMFILVSILVIAVLFMAFVIWGTILNKQEKRKNGTSAQRVTKEEIPRQKETPQDTASGRWSFPVAKFYQYCCTSNIEALNSSYAEKIATNIAKQLLEDAHIPERYHHMYCTTEQLSQYFEKGKIEAERVEAERQAERRTVKVGHLSETETQSVALAKKVSDLCGISKRKAMIDDVIEKINKRILDVEEAQAAIKQVGMLLGTSVRQEKKKDWAILGGLAEGIAGPGAGIAVAANAMIENQEIERRNQQARQEAINVAKSFYDSAYKLSDDIAALEKEKKLMENHKRQLDRKELKSTYTTEELFEMLQLKATVGKAMSRQGTKLSVSVTNKFPDVILKDSRLVVDGTINAAIYLEGTLVDTVCVCLPLFGVARGTTEKVVAFTDRYAEADGGYTVKFEPNKLWIMKA